MSVLNASNLYVEGEYYKNKYNRTAEDLKEGVNEIDVPRDWDEAGDLIKTPLSEEFDPNEVTVDRIEEED